MSDTPVDHHADEISYFECDAQVLLDQQNGDLAFVNQRAQRCGDVFNDHRRQALGGLVHHQ